MKTIEQLLEEIKNLQERSEKGEDVSAELASTRQELEQLKAAQADDGGSGNGGGLTPEQQELAQLRAEKQQREEQEIASRVAVQAVKAVTDQEQARQERIQGYVVDAVQKALGGQGLEDLLKNARGGSRFAGEGADPALAQLLAQGGAVPVAGNGDVSKGVGVPGAGLVLPGQADLSRIQGGDVQGVKEIEERKSLAEFCSIIARAKHGPFLLNQAEQQFLAKQFTSEVAGKAMAQGTPSAGGYLVPEQWMPDILTPLRAQAVVRRAGPRVVGFDKQMNQVNMSSGATAYYTNENARITPSEPTVAQATLLTPKFLTALVPVSNVLLGNWARGDQTIRDDMVEAVQVREDLSFLQGTGGAGDPVLGFRNIVGGILNPLAPGADGFVPTLPQFRSIKGRTRLVGAPNPRWVWFFHPSILTYLETLTDTTGRFLIDSGLLQINDDGVSGRFDGFPFYASYQIPTNLTLGTSTNVTYVLLVDVNDAIIGEEEQLALAVSSEATYSPDGGTTHVSAFQQNQTVFRAIMGHDIAHRRPATGIIVQEGVRTA